LSADPSARRQQAVDLRAPLPSTDFGVFAAVWLRELPRWNEVVAFGLILASVVVANLPRV
jgi:uncharacterized protein (DUF486 family)